jgi:predicted glycoside hydrolase/deacetylase ChbG (UPF0249 family)
MQPNIIINADDYGLAKRFNEGILNLARKKIITSVSVMINRNFINAQELLALQNFSIGLHLELNSKTTRKEIEEQIKKFLTLFQCLPSHLDGHKHCHLTKPNLPLILEIAKKLNFPVRSHFSEDQKIIQKAKVKTPDRFISWHPKRKKKFLQKLDQIQSGTTELVCHPGYFDKNCKYPYNRQREAEMKILKSKEFQKILKNYKQINYRSF